MNRKLTFSEIFTIINIFTGLCIGGIIGIGLKFVGLYLYFPYIIVIPTWVNLFDATVLLASSCFLGYRILRGK